MKTFCLLLVGLLLASPSFALTQTFAWERSTSCTDEEPCGVNLYLSTTQGGPYAYGPYYHQPEVCATTNEGIEECVAEVDIPNLRYGKDYYAVATAYRLSDLYESDYSNEVSFNLTPDSPEVIHLPPVEKPAPLRNFLRKLFGGVASF